MIQPIQNFEQNNNQKNLLSRVPLFVYLNSQIDPPQVDRKPFIIPPTSFSKTHNWHTSDKNNSLNVTSNESINLFIDKLIKGQETKLIQNHDTVSSFSIFQREFESRHLLPIELIRFNGNPCK